MPTIAVVHALTLLTLLPTALSAPTPSQYSTAMSTEQHAHTHTHMARQLPVGDLKLLNLVVPGSGIPESVGRLSADFGGRKHL
ncbi:hypothetical protein BJY00DRAFT_283575 [Aspergillus carlsbadensis]|nr:hypothetical protein BJY00DRAFT_283575 [Aspergillus carlsbadensis]